MPKGLIIGCRKTRQTAELLAEVAMWDYTETYVNSISEYGAIFRYGNSAELALPVDGPLDAYCRNIGRRMINRAKDIRLACNKPEARKQMLACGVPCPHLWDSIEGFRNFPVIARPIFHSKGRKFFVCNTLAEATEYMTPEFYVSELIDKKDEYRVIVLGGKVVECSIKVKMRPDADNLIRNHRKGWGFKWIPYEDVKRSIVDHALSAIKALNLSFGAVDMCIDTKDYVFVFEVNTAPGLIRRKAEKIAERINAMIM